MHDVKKSLGAIHYSVLFVTSQSNDKFTEFVYKIKVMRFYSPDEKQV
jgi:hypothetical protein